MEDEELYFIFESDDEDEDQIIFVPDPELTETVH